MPFAAWFERRSAPMQSAIRLLFQVHNATAHHCRYAMNRIPPSPLPSLSMPCAMPRMLPPYTPQHQPKRAPLLLPSHERLSPRWSGLSVTSPPCPPLLPRSSSFTSSRRVTGFAASRLRQNDAAAVLRLLSVSHCSFIRLVHVILRHYRSPSRHVVHTGRRRHAIAPVRHWRRSSSAAVLVHAITPSSGSLLQKRHRTLFVTIWLILVHNAHICLFIREETCPPERHCVVEPKTRRCRRRR